jgi:hypothetical protein
MSASFARSTKSRLRKRALKILRWLVYAERQLTVTEVLEVTGIYLEEDPRVDEDEVLRDSHDILRVCSGFVSITTAVEGSNESDNDDRTDDQSAYNGDADAKPRTSLQRRTMARTWLQIRLSPRAIRC